MTPTSTQFQEKAQASSLTARGSSYSRTFQTGIDRASWTELCLERFAIMTIDGGIPEPLAKEKAFHDTTLRFGRRPAEGKAA